jgi:hypothetical protein
LLDENVHHRKGKGRQEHVCDPTTESAG